MFAERLVVQGANASRWQHVAHPIFFHETRFS
jgi:hypothetical protein